MKNVWMFTLFFIALKWCHVFCKADADEFPVSDEPGVHSQVNPCQATLQTGELINLKPLSRLDGLPQFFFEGSVWNYSFNPCTSYNEPKDPHIGFGDGCASVVMCVFGEQENKHYYYALGIERNSRIRVIEKNENNTDIQLVLRGAKSNKNRLTFIKLVCDRNRVEPKEALFKISSSMEGRASSSV